MGAWGGWCVAAAAVVVVVVHVHVDHHLQGLRDRLLVGDAAVRGLAGVPDGSRELCGEVGLQPRIGHTIGLQAPVSIQQAQGPWKQSAAHQRA